MHAKVQIFVMMMMMMIFSYGLEAPIDSEHRTIQ